MFSIHDITGITLQLLDLADDTNLVVQEVLLAMAEIYWMIHLASILLASYYNLSDGDTCITCFFIYCLRVSKFLSVFLSPLFYMERGCLEPRLQDKTNQPIKSLLCWFVLMHMGIIYLVRVVFNKSNIWLHYASYFVLLLDVLGFTVTW